METLGHDTTICILTFLELPAVFSLLSTSKSLLSLWTDDSVWRVLLTREQSPTLHINTEPSFSIKRCLAYRTALWTNIHLEAPISFLQTTLATYHKVRIIPLKSVAESSHDYDQDISRTLSAHEDHFWSSIGSPTTDSNEFLRYRLAFPAFLFWVGVRLFRAGYQGGYLYPPVQFQVKIGLEEGVWNYVSEPVNAQATESLQHLIVLPAMILGKYMELGLIGKVQTQETDSLYYVAIEHVRCIGLPADLYPAEHHLGEITPYPIGDLPLDIDNSTYELWAQKLVSHPEMVQREHLETIHELGNSADYFDRIRKSKRRFTKIESYFYLENTDLDQDLLNLTGMTLSEDLGDLLVEKGHVRVALAVFARIQVLRKMVKCLLLLRRFAECMMLSSSQHYGAPNIDELKTMASSLGILQELEDFLLNPPELED